MINFELQSVMIMENKEQLDQIKDIKKMMDKASRFSSLSGLSVIIAGLLALIGAFLVYSDLEFMLKGGLIGYSDMINTDAGEDLDRKIKFLLIIGAFILTCSILLSYILSKLKAKRENTEFWNPTFKRATKALFVPVIAGGIFSLLLVHHGAVGMVAPASLIFYGLGLINASKYTYGEVEVLGYVELILGLIASYFMGMGLLFWAIGFGLCHIVFGFVLYYIHDRK